MGKGCPTRLFSKDAPNTPSHVTRGRRLRHSDSASPSSMPEASAAPPLHLALALVVRVSVALCTRTFFQPDEYFQSLEVAHRVVFGYGALTWEWLSPRPIRSILYPALNIPL